MADLILTLIGPDRPGIVEAVAERVASHGGNWAESRMAHLAGRFAGILRVEVPDAQAQALEAALRALASTGLELVIEGSRATEAAPSRAMDIELLGLDRPGLVRQISELLARQGVNVEELETDQTSAPMSGERLFRARLRVHVPQAVAAIDLRSRLEQLASDLMVEIKVAEALGGRR